MKTNNLILMLLVVAVSFLLGSTYANQVPAREDGRTEEYAIITVKHMGRNHLVIEQIGNKPTVEKEYPAVADKIYDLTPVFADFERLNAQGFELVNSSLAFIPGANFGGAPFYSFMFKRKL